MAVLDNANLTGNLHFRPISSHLTRAVTFGATSVRQLAEENTWQGRTVDFISKASLFVGACLIVPVALIETITSLSIALMGLLANHFLFCDQIDFLQKHSLKLLSFAFHSGVTTIANFMLAFRMPELRYHTANALIDNGIYLGTAAFAQFVVGSLIDQSCGRSLELSRMRTFNLLRDSHPDLLQDVAAQMQRDFGIHLLNRLGNIPALDEYLARHPEDREFITNFQFEQLRNPDYRAQAFVFARRFLAETGLIRREAAEEQGMRLEVSQVSPAEKEYQDTLCALIRNAIIEVHTTPDLVRHLDQRDTSGQDRIEMFDGPVVQPLLCYAQYKEILGVIQCPQRFTTNELLPYSNRRERLMLVHAQIANFSRQERDLLCKKILRGADFEVHGRVQQAFLQISELASDLERGALMTKSYIDLEHAQDGDLITNEILYQSSWRGALREIERRAEIAEEVRGIEQELE